MNDKRLVGIGVRESLSGPRSALLLLLCLLPGAGAIAADTQPAAPTGIAVEVGDVSRLQQSLDSAIANTRQLEAELSRRDEAVADLRIEQGRLESELAQARDRLQQAQVRLEATTSEQRLLDERVRKSEATLETARADLDRVAAERDRLMADLQRTRDDLAQRERTIGDLTGQRDRLEQAAGEAERQAADLRAELAATVAERDRLSTESSRLRAELDQRTAELAQVRGERDGAMQSLAATRAELQSELSALSAMTGERDRLSARLAQTEDRLAETQGALDASRVTTAGLEQDLVQAGRRDADRQSTIARLQAELRESEDGRRQLQGMIAELKAGLPPQLGGSATLDQLHRDAAAIAGRMRSMHQTLRRQPDNRSLQQAYGEAASRLRGRQLLIAGETGASGLYRLRPEDTLAVVASRTLGDGKHWPRLYEANRHVLDDPDRLIPGLTLVLP